MNDFLINKPFKVIAFSRALHSELFSEIRVEFWVGTSFRESRRDELNVIFFVIFVRYFFVFSENRENENCEKKAIFVIFSRKSQKLAIFASSEMFEKLGNYRIISEVRKTAISETFGKKRLTQGPSFFSILFFINLRMIALLPIVWCPSIFISLGLRCIIARNTIKTFVTLRPKPYSIFSSTYLVSSLRLCHRFRLT